MEALTCINFFFSRALVSSSFGRAPAAFSFRSPTDRDVPLKGSFERDHSEVLSGDTNQVISQHLGVRNSGTTGLGYASFMVR